MDRPSAQTAVVTKYAIVIGLLLASVVAAVVGTAATAPAPVAGVVEPGTFVRFSIPVVRVLLDIAAVTAVGLSLLAKFLGFDRPEQTEPLMRVARRGVVLASAVWAGAAVVAVVLQTAELSPGGFPSLGMVWSYVTQVAAGKGLALSALFAGACFGFGLLAVKHGEKVPAELRIGVALFGLLPLPVTGHAANWDYHDLSMISMELHVMGAAAWTGGLAVLVLLVAPRRGLLAVALPRFSKLATIAVFLVAGTGIANGLIQLALTPGAALPDSLLTTGYGQLLIAKTACWVAVALSGAHIRTRLMPRVARHERTALVTWAAVEVAVMGVAYGLAVVLTRAPIVPN